MPTRHGKSVVFMIPPMVTAHSIIVVIPLTILVNGHEAHVSRTSLRCDFFLLLPGTGGGSYTWNFFFPFDPSFLETWTDTQTDGHTVAFIYKIVNEWKHRPLVLRSRLKSQLRSRLLVGRWDFPLSWVRIEGAVSFLLRHLAGLFRSKLNASPPISIDSFCAGAIFSPLSLFTSQTVSTFWNLFSCFCYCFPSLEFELQKSILGSRVWVFPLVCCILWVCGLGQVCLLFTVQVTQSQIGALISMGFRFKLAC